MLVKVRVSIRFGTRDSFDFRVKVSIRIWLEVEFSVRVWVRYIVGVGIRVWLRNTCELQMRVNFQVIVF